MSNMMPALELIEGELLLEWMCCGVAGERGRGIVNKFKMSVPKRGEEARKITIKEFEWYEVETKVRELLTELLHPFTKKQSEDTIKINEIKRNIASLTRKTEDHDFFLTQEAPNKPTYIELQDAKIEDTIKRLSLLEECQNKRISHMEKVMEVYEGKIKQLNKLEEKLDQQVQQRGELFISQKEYVDSQIKLMFNKLEVEEQEINTMRQSTRNSLNKLETKLVVLDNRETALEEDLKRRTLQIKKVQDSISKLSERVSKQDYDMKDLDNRIAQREKDFKLSEKFLTKTTELSNDISFISNYLQYYQPLYNQLQITESLNSFIKGSDRIRLCLFEEKTYARYHNAILKMESEALETKMGDFSDRIRRVINRNKKYVIRLKVDQTFRYGGNVYQLREFTEEMIHEMDAEAHAQPPPIVIPEDQINKIVEDKWDKLSKTFQSLIDGKMEPMEVWIRELQEQHLMKDVAIDKRIEELEGKLEKQSTNLELQKMSGETAIKEAKKDIELLAEDYRKSKEYLKELISFSSVINHIVIQDQIDRQGLALYALKGPQKVESYPSIRLDEKCVSCTSGNANSLVSQAFKIACLAYNPSEIKVDDQSFSREQILEISTRILDRLKKRIEEPPSIEIQVRNPEPKTNEIKSRSRSSMSRNGNKLSHTIDAPARLRDTTYLLPVLGSTRKGRKEL